MGQELKTYHIVLVEDNRGDVFLIEEALRSAGLPFRLTRYADGDVAIDLLSRTFEPPPDLILVDLNLPKVDGLDVLRELKHMPHLSETPAAILTSSQSPRDKQATQSYGAHYIEKPPTLSEFLSQVGGAVDRILKEANRAAFSEPA